MTNEYGIRVERMMRLFHTLLSWLLIFLAITVAISCGSPAVVSEDATPDLPPSPTVVAATPTARVSGTAGEALSPLPTPTRGAVATGATQTATAQEIHDDLVSPLATPTVAPSTADSTPVYGYRIVNIYPHDRGAFTQGLVFTDSILYEGTGLYGQSSLRKVELETGEILTKIDLASSYFGEGITIYGERVVQLTWRENVGFVYDKETFDLLDTFNYPTQGWGITHDGQRLIMSDGSATLYFWNPETFEEIGQVQVYDEYGPVIRLNELEYIHGQVYANVWQTDRVAIIDPQSGQVTAWLDLAGLLEPEDLDPPVDVLNGIAYDHMGDRLFVTGKLWPKLFEIEIVAPQLVFMPLVRGPAVGQHALAEQ
jgi:glutamine cyclotransferase